MSSNEEPRRIRCAALAAGLLMLLGASASVADDPGMERASEIAPAAASGEPFGRGLTLGDALALALKQSPDLASFSWEIRARESRALQAGLRPNPIFRVDAENIGGPGPLGGIESVETTLLLSQLIELGGKRAKRRSLGEFQVKVAEWDYEAARLAVIAETTAAFVDALAGQEAIRLAGDQIRLAEDVLRAVKAQVRAGALSSAAVPHVELALTKQQIDRRSRVRALRTAYVRLATAWGASEPTFKTLAGDLDILLPIPLEAELVERMSASPELARWRAEVTKRRAAIELEDARGIPDVTLGLGPRHFNNTSDWALVIGLEVPIPVFDRNQGARQASRSQLARSRVDQQSVKLRLRRALARSYQGLASASEEAAALREQAIPIAERALEETRHAQRQGALHFTEVLNAQRSLFELRTRLVVALATYHLSRAQTETLIGGPLGPEKDSIQ
jgi:cobalt-zinc-cadmium efflux system outer membrane protein